MPRHGVHVCVQVVYKTMERKDHPFDKAPVPHPFHFAYNLFYVHHWSFHYEYDSTEHR